MNDNRTIPATPADVNDDVVLAVIHHVTRSGKVKAVELKPNPCAPTLDVGMAAYYAARRAHPWILDDDSRDREAIGREIALKQLHELVHASSALLFAIDQARPMSCAGKEEREAGYRLAVQHLRFCDEAERTRNALKDLRAYITQLTRPAVGT